MNSKRHKKFSSKNPAPLRILKIWESSTPMTTVSEYNRKNNKTKKGEQFCNTILARKVENQRIIIFGTQTNVELFSSATVCLQCRRQDFSQGGLRNI